MVSSCYKNCTIKGGVNWKRTYAFIHVSQADFYILNLTCAPCTYQLDFATGTISILCKKSDKESIFSLSKYVVGVYKACQTSEVIFITYGITWSETQNPCVLFNHDLTQAWSIADTSLWYLVMYIRYFAVDALQFIFFDRDVPCIFPFEKLFKMTRFKQQHALLSIYALWRYLPWFKMIRSLLENFPWYALSCVGMGIVQVDIIDRQAIYFEGPNVRLQRSRWCRVRDGDSSVYSEEGCRGKC